MATVFYVIGWLVIIAGAAFVALGVSTFAQMSQAYGPMTALAASAGLATGLGTAFGGLLILAIGGVLGRLDRIVDNTGR